MGKWARYFFNLEITFDWTKAILTDVGNQRPLKIPKRLWIQNLWASKKLEQMFIRKYGFWRRGAQKNATVDFS